MLNPITNPKNVSFEEYSKDPDLMFDMQAGFARHNRFEIPGDHEMGVPEDGWSVEVDFENYYEAGWLGAPVEFPKDNVPFAMPFLKDDNKRMLFDKGVPDPFSGLMGECLRFYERFQERAKDFQMDGVGVAHISASGLYADGPFTVACGIRGAENFCVDLYEDPDYAQELLAFLTEATIVRLTAWRKLCGHPVTAKGFGFADDAIALLSTDCYRERVLPHHKRWAAATSEPGDGFAHLCGDATRHFPTLIQELNVRTFDTGFPVRHAELVKTLGPDITIQGGPTSQFVHGATPEAIEAECLRILDEVKPLTKKFILRDGNDIAPGTPIENMRAMVNASKKSGGWS